MTGISVTIHERKDSAVRFRRALYQFGAFAALIVLAGLSGLVSKSGFMAYEDATMLFNYYNGVGNPKLIFYYPDYIEIGPYLVAFLSSYFSGGIQGDIYILFSVICSAIMTYGLYILLQHSIGQYAAFATSTILLILVHRICQPLHLNVTYSIWIMPLAVLFWWVEKLCYDSRTSNIAVLAAFFGSASSPVALALMPGAIILSLIGRDQVDRRHFILIAAILVYYAAVFAFNPHPSTLTLANVSTNVLNDIARIPRYNGWVLFANLIPLVALATSGALILSWPSTFIETRTRWACLFLLSFGWISLLFYFGSARFNLEVGASDRYVVPLAATTYATLCLCVGLVLNRFSRPAIVACALVWLATVSLGNVARQIADIGHKYRFLQDTSGWNKSCNERHEALKILDRNDRWSPALPCQKWARPSNAGFYPIDLDHGTLMEYMTIQPKVPFVFSG